MQNTDKQGVFYFENKPNRTIVISSIILGTVFYNAECGSGSETTTPILAEKNEKIKTLSDEIELKKQEVLNLQNDLQQEKANGSNTASYTAKIQQLEEQIVQLEDDLQKEKSNGSNPASYNAKIQAKDQEIQKLKTDLQKEKNKGSNPDETEKITDLNQEIINLKNKLKQEKEKVKLAEQDAEELKKKLDEANKKIEEDKKQQEKKLFFEKLELSKSKESYKTKLNREKLKSLPIFETEESDTLEILQGKETKLQSILKSLEGKDPAFLQIDETGNTIFTNFLSEFINQQLKANVNTIVQKLSSSGKLRIKEGVFIVVGKCLYEITTSFDFSMSTLSFDLEKTKNAIYKYCIDNNGKIYKKAY